MNILGVQQVILKIELFNSKSFQTILKIQMVCPISSQASLYVCGGRGGGGIGVVVHKGIESDNSDDHNQSCR